MSRKKIDLNSFMGLFAFLVLFGVFSLLAGPSMVSAYNLTNVIDQTMQIIVGGLGVMFIVAMGSVDLSIGGLAAVAASAGCLLSDRFGSWAMIPATLAIGVAVGFLNGVLVTRFRISSFMCTLAMLISLRGVLSLFLANTAIYAPPLMKTLNVFPVRFGFLVLLTLVMGYLFEFTSLGRCAKAMGENETTVRTIGIPADTVRIAAFALTGLMAGFVGLYQISKLGGASATMGSFMEMKIMMAIFLGGVPVTGGFRTHLYKMVIGAFTISIVINGLTLINVSTKYAAAIQGVLLMAVLFATVWQSGRKQKAEPARA